MLLGKHWVLIVGVLTLHLFAKLIAMIDRAAIVPPDTALRAGLLPSQVQVSEKYGGGYPASVEGLHHLHCLNLLRQTLWFNYDYYHNLGQGAFLNEDHILRVHVSEYGPFLALSEVC